MANSTELETGHDYALRFGFRDGTKMIYNGGVSWTCVRADGKSMTADAPKQTEQLRADIASDSRLLRDRHESITI